MAQREPSLGECPDCETVIPKRGLLATVERVGWPTTFAECPTCGAVVHPA